MSFFEITHKSTDCQARVGVLRTDHGDVETPIFMPVGTQATVKTLDSKDLEDLAVQIILANTYHLHLRPGEDVLDKFGGIHKFMKWDKPILTDSGGFQVFSLGKQMEEKGQHGSLVDIDDEGVTFRSHIDGSKHRFTPEEAIKIQHKIGADIIMAFDECTPDDADKQYTMLAMKRTHEWAERCVVEHNKNLKHHGYKQFLFGIIQGANHKGLREESARAISAMNFDGIAIGGESVGYNMEATKNILDWVSPIIPEDKPHYTMGLGHSPTDLFDVVERGVDMFDCVSPTRMARNGTLFVHKSISKNYRINIKNAQFKLDELPIDEFLKDSPVGHYSRSYIHHLFDTNETLGLKIATMHNLYFFLKLMQDIREAIKEDRFMELKHEWC